MQAIINVKNVFNIKKVDKRQKTVGIGDETVTLMRKN